MRKHESGLAFVSLELIRKVDFASDQLDCLVLLKDAPTKDSHRWIKREANKFPECGELSENEDRLENTGRVHATHSSNCI